MTFSEKTSSEGREPRRELQQSREERIGFRQRRAVREAIEATFVADVSLGGIDPMPVAASRRFVLTSRGHQGYTSLARGCATCVDARVSVTGGGDRTPNGSNRVAC